MKNKLLQKIISKKMTIPLFLLAGVGVVVMSCGGGGSSGSSRSSENSSSSAQAVSQDAMAEAKQFFVATCVACHGESGRGDGPASKGLTPPPRDLSDSKWQESVDDEYLAKIIQYGGGAVGKSVAMPNNPSLGSKPELLKAVVAYVRTLKQ